MSPTHQRILNGARTESREEDFLAAAKAVVEGHRLFTSDDLEMFIFPDGYKPIAVATEQNYAIGFREVNDGVELCFQLPNEAIISQIDKLQQANADQILKLREMNESFEKAKGKYKKQT